MPVPPNSLTAVSVLVPTRNRPDTLPSVLGALAAQDVGGLDPELVVVDNGSETSTRDATARLLVDFPWPARLVDEPAAGVAAARNAAVASAGHDILVFLNDDVVPASTTWLRGHVARLTSAEDDRTVVLGPVTWHPDVPLTPVMAWLEASGKSHSYDRVRKGESPPGELYANNLSLWRSPFEAAGGFDPRFTSYGWQEYDLALRMGDGGLRIAFDDTLGAWHHHHHDLTISLKREEKIGRSAVLFEALNADRDALDTPQLSPGALRAGAAVDRIRRHVRLPERLPRAALRALHRAALAAGIREGQADPALSKARR